MADRQTKVTLAAQVQQYVDGMEKARKKTQETASEAEKLAQTKKQFDLLGRTALAAGGLVAVGLGLAVAKFAEFDQAMSNVQAATHESAENMELLSKAALDAGAATVYSATEAAGAIEELAKAGLSTQDILSGGLSGALDLAAAGGLDVAEAAGIAATTMQQFGLKGNQAAHVADLLAAGAGKAMGDVSDMAMALKQSGLVANQFGISVEETAGALAAFASKGLLGSDAGTSFKTMLLQLAKPSKEAAALMKQLGIEAYDSAGNFVGLAGLAGELQDGLAGLTEQQKQSSLATIFGTDAIRSATVLYEEGAAGIEKWTNKVDDAGYAAETAATRLDNLKGDVEALQGAVDSALISMGSAADGPLRSVVQALTDLVNKFNDMPEAGKQAVFWIGALGAAGATALGTYVLLVPKIAEFNRALELLGPNAQKTNRAVANLARIGVVATAIGVATYGVDALAQAMAEKLLPSAEEIDNKMRSAKSGVELFATALNKEGITNTRQASELLRNLSKDLDAVADSDFWHPANLSGTAVTVIKSIAETARTDLPEAQAQFRQLAEDGALTDRQMRTLIKSVPELKNALLTYADTSDGAADSQDLLNILLGDAEDTTGGVTDAYADAAAQAEEYEAQLSDLIATMKEANGLGQDAVSANARYVTSLAGIAKEVERQKDAYKGVHDTLDGFSLSLDQSTEAGAANAAMLAGVAADAQAAAEAQYELDQQTMSAEDATQKYADTLAAQRKAFEDSATAAGFNSDEVKALADQVFALPSEKEIEILASTADAAKAIDEFVRTYDGKVITLQLTTNQVQVNGRVYGGLRDGRAAGGAIVGPGGPTDDRAGAYDLSNGEHVLTAADVDAMGGQHAVYAFRDGLHSGGSGGYAGGQPVQVFQEINPAPGMSEVQIGRIAAEQAAFAYRGAGT